MPQWAGSCWYYLRYLDPHNANALAAQDKIGYWLPVDLYVGGAEHAVLHLLYSRFWHKVLYDCGLVNSVEPFQRLINQGMILGEDNQKMSKSRGNVINPDDIIKNYGADAMRVYEMFMGPLEVSKPWITAGLIGVSRFLERLWAIGEKPVTENLTISDPHRPLSLLKQTCLPSNSGNDRGSRHADSNQETQLDAVPSPVAPLPTPHSPELHKLLHRTIKKVTADTASLNFNTAISAMMIYSNELAKLNEIPRALWEPLVIMISAYAPHLGEELWEKLGHTNSVSACSWPGFDEALTHDDEVTVVVQVNGKIRDKFTAATGTATAELEKTALALPGVLKWTEGHTVAKVISIPDKLVNIVVK
jgi:leucyl-tRNA synthetase